MLRAAATLALALVLPGCGGPPGVPVKLLTGPLPFDADECSTTPYVASMLLFDDEYGTVLAGFPRGTRIPVMWPEGYTAQRVEDQVAVRNADGYLVAFTDVSYSIKGNILFEVAEPGLSTYRRGVVVSPIDQDVFYACGQVRPAATSHPADE